MPEEFKRIAKIVSTCPTCRKPGDASKQRSRAPRPRVPFYLGVRLRPSPEVALVGRAAHGVAAYRRLAALRCQRPRTTSGLASVADSVSIAIQVGRKDGGSLLLRNCQNRRRAENSVTEVFVPGDRVLTSVRGKPVEVLVVVVQIDRASKAGLRRFTCTISLDLGALPCSSFRPKPGSLLFPQSD
jgi:hypothetical protein